MQNTLISPPLPHTKVGGGPRGPPQTPPGVGGPRFGGGGDPQTPPRAYKYIELYVQKSSPKWGGWGERQFGDPPPKKRRGGGGEGPRHTGDPPPVVLGCRVSPLPQHAATPPGWGVPIFWGVPHSGGGQGVLLGGPPRPLKPLAGGDPDVGTRELLDDALHLVVNLLETVALHHG